MEQKTEGDVNHWVLGLSFMQQFIMIHDNSQQRIGLLQIWDRGYLEENQDSAPTDGDNEITNDEQQPVNGEEDLEEENEQEREQERVRERDPNNQSNLVDGTVAGAQELEDNKVVWITLFIVVTVLLMMLILYWCYIKRKREQGELNADNENPGNFKLGAKVGIDVNATEQAMNNEQTVMDGELDSKENMDFENKAMDIKLNKDLKSRNDDEELTRTGSAQVIHTKNKDSISSTGPLIVAVASAASETRSGSVVKKDSQKFVRATVAPQAKKTKSEVSPVKSQKSIPSPLKMQK